MVTRLVVVARDAARAEAIARAVTRRTRGAVDVRVHHCLARIRAAEEREQARA